MGCFVSLFDGPQQRGVATLFAAQVLQLRCCSHELPRSSPAAAVSSSPALPAAPHTHAQEAERKGLLQDPLPPQLLQLDEEEAPLMGLLPALRAMHAPASEEEREVRGWVVGVGAVLGSGLPACVGLSRHA